VGDSVSPSRGLTILPKHRGDDRFARQRSPLSIALTCDPAAAIAGRRISAFSSAVFVARARRNGALWCEHRGDKANVTRNAAARSPDHPHTE
jgi:hypothetical protein